MDNELLTQTTSPWTVHRLSADYSRLQWTMTDYDGLNWAMTDCQIYYYTDRATELY